MTRQQIFPRTATMLSVPALVAMMFAFASAPAAAEEEYALVYSASDFQSSQSIRDLHKKIVHTAKDHCPSYFVTRSLPDVTRCVEEVVQNLVRVIDNAELSAYAEGDTGLRVAQEIISVDDRS